MAIVALQAFGKHHSDVQRITGQLNTQPTMVDLAHYCSILKNKAIVDEVEKVLHNFKPVMYNVSGHVNAIETLETKAMHPILFFFILFFLPMSIILCTKLFFFLAPGGFCVTPASCA
jgi:hypothetical protein